MKGNEKMFCELCELEMPPSNISKPVVRKVEEKEHYFCCIGCAEAYMKEIEFRDFDKERSQNN